MGRRRGAAKNCGIRRWSDNQYPFERDEARGMVDTWCGERRSHERGEAFPSA